MHPDKSLPFRAGPGPSDAQQELCFLNTTGTLELDTEARAAIRAQSLRDYHRKRKLQPKSEDNGSSTTSESQASNGSKASVQRFRLGSDGLRLTQTQPRPGFAGKAGRKGAPGQRVWKVSLKGKPGEEEERTNEATIIISQRAPSPPPNLEVSRGDFDPFDALPLPSTPRIQLLVKQCQSYTRWLPSNTLSKHG